MASWVELANEALIKATYYDDFITDLSEQIKPAVLINKVYLGTHASVLRSHIWNFATTRVQLTKESVGPAFGGLNYFAIPADAVRILTDPDEPYGEFNVEGRKIIASGTTFNLIYSSMVTNPALFDALYCEAFTTKLAQTICLNLTGDKALYAALGQQYREDLSLAKSIDGSEHGMQTLIANEFLYTFMSG